MKPEKIHILGIVPYEGMKYALLKQAELYKNIDLTVFVGDLYEGAAIVQKSLPEDYDVIISRGGTAELIRPLTQLPVIEIELSIYDILRSIKMADNFAPNYTIVGFPSITKNAQILCDLMQYPAQICTIHNAEEVPSVLSALQQQGCRIIICDTITNTTAKQMGMNAILINSGAESINHALEQAVNFCQNHSRLRGENNLLKQVLTKSEYDTIIFNEKHEMVFSTIVPADINDITSELCTEAEHMSDAKTYRFFKDINGVLYSIISQLLSIGDVSYNVFYLTENKIPFTSGKYGVKYHNLRDLDNSFFNCFYVFTNNHQNPLPTLGELCQSSLPIMIIGEDGTGPEHVAEALYAKSALSNAPLISIDFSLINDKAWMFLTNHYNSPFNDNNNTIYFRNINCLSPARTNQLLSLILDTNFARRNRIIFSFTHSIRESIPESCLECINRLSCLTLYLPPLRERTAEIPALANLLLSALNVRYSREILGLDNDALKHMQNYHWPGNYLQFQRILTDLAMATSDSYIVGSHMEKALKKELVFDSSANDVSSPGSATGEIINTEQTLSKITLDIIRIVLKKNNGNQSAAAKQLGIGRTTLWRFLKDAE